MCGRFTLATPPEIVAEFFELPDFPELPPRYNIAPTHPVVAVVRSPTTGDREIRLFRWGLIPHWAHASGSNAATVIHSAKLINARAETVAEKPAYRDAFRHRRCLIIADGFYEWKKLAKGKRPYYIRMTDRSPFAFAGLWESWRWEGLAVESCTVITGEPNELVRDLHDRMPVILDKSAYDLWLDPRNADLGELRQLLRPYPAAQMTAFAVSTLVNRPERDEPGCIQPSELFE